MLGIVQEDVFGTLVRLTVIKIRLWNFPALSWLAKGSAVIAQREKESTYYETEPQMLEHVPAGVTLGTKADYEPSVRQVD